MTKINNIVEALGLDDMRKATAEKLLDSLWALEDEQLYENKTVSKLIDYLQNKYLHVDKPTVYFESRGESGNIFALISLVRKALRDDKKCDALWAKIKQGSYAQAIELIKQHVNLIDADGVY